MQGCYYVYIVTNPKKTVLYIGVTNSLYRRILEHLQNKGNPKTFAGRYYCYKLIYFESHSNIEHAIAREKQLKGWSRQKKEALIHKFNPEWNTLNASFFP